MHRTDVAVVGAGPAGLAVSRCLARRGVEHAVLEAGRVAESWRSARWDSLRLITPNWLTRLPDMTRGGSGPAGFMTAHELAARLIAYARRSGAPIHEFERVLRLAREGGAYRLETPRGAWRARAVVIATGACDRPYVPAFAANLPSSVQQVAPAAYRNPDGLSDGHVLVIGASATGVQLAREIQASGRQVMLAAGRHTRMVRRYRGRDIFAWLDASGVLDEAWTDIAGLAAARRQPSMQLSSSGALDLAGLAAAGVRVVGRVLRADGARLLLADNLARDCAASDARLRRVLARIDAYVAAQGVCAQPDPSAREIPSHPVAAGGSLDLVREGIRSVVWATGFRRGYPWLKVPVFDAAGEIRHDGGVTPAPGLYVIGLPLLRRRSSSFVSGIGRDAEELAGEITAHLGRPSLAA